MLRKATRLVFMVVAVVAGACLGEPADAAKRLSVDSGSGRGESPDAGTTAHSSESARLDVIGGAMFQTGLGFSAAAAAVAAALHHATATVTILAAGSVVVGSAAAIAGMALRHEEAKKKRRLIRGALYVVTGGAYLTILLAAATFLTAYKGHHG